MYHFIIVLFFISAIRYAYSQDIHFSQFYAMPLTLNPALTGKVHGDYRIAAIYRGQWWGHFKNKAYATPAIAFDLPYLIGKKKQDALGGGLVMIADRTNGGRFNTNMIYLSAAYHKGLGGQNKHQLSLGIQAGYIMAQLKSNDFTYGDQIVNGQVVNNTSTEVFANNNRNFADVNAGVFYNAALTSKITLFAGYGINHLFTPSLEFRQGSGNEVPLRHLAHGGLQWNINDRFSAYPGVLFQRQSNAREINFGNNFGWHFYKKDNTQATFYFGGWYRLKDAAIAMVGLEYNRIRVGVSYDFTVSDLNNVNRVRGGFEISALYVGLFNRPVDNNIFLFCPRF